MEPQEYDVNDHKISKIRRPKRIKDRYMKRSRDTYIKFQNLQGLLLLQAHQWLLTFFFLSLSFSLPSPNSKYKIRTVGVRA